MTTTRDRALASVAILPPRPDSAEAEAELAESVTTWARRRRDSARYGDRPPGVPLAVWRAYGPRYPGSAQRWLDQAAEREWAKRFTTPEPPLPPGEPIDLDYYGDANRAFEESEQAERGRAARALWVRAHRKPRRWAA